MQSDMGITLTFFYFLIPDFFVQNNFNAKHLLRNSESYKYIKLKKSKSLELDNSDKKDMKSSSFCHS